VTAPKFKLAHVRGASPKAGLTRPSALFIALWIDPPL
jgi:hypothetical protein